MKLTKKEIEILEELLEYSSLNVENLISCTLRFFKDFKDELDKLEINSNMCDSPIQELNVAYNRILFSKRTQEDIEDDLKEAEEFNNALKDCIEEQYGIL